MRRTLCPLLPASHREARWNRLGCRGASETRYAAEG